MPLPAQPAAARLARVSRIHRPATYLSRRRERHKNESWRALLYNRSELHPLVLAVCIGATVKPTPHVRHDVGAAGKLFNRLATSHRRRQRTDERWFYLRVLSS
jgi:hypothetical protein